MSSSTGDRPKSNPCDLLERAANDLRSAAQFDTKELHEIAGYMLNRAVEKSLIALCHASGQSWRAGDHSGRAIRRLFRILGECNMEMRSFHSLSDLELYNDDQVGIDFQIPLRLDLSAYRKKALELHSFVTSIVQKS